MYKDASRWSLAFQSYVQLTMAEGHRKDVKDKVKTVTTVFLSYVPLLMKHHRI